MPEFASPAGDGDVLRWWRDLGLPGLIDMHVHFMPESVLRKVWAHFDDAGPLVGRPWPVAYRLPEEERLAVLRGLGVRAFPSLVYPHKPAMAVWLNEWAAEFAARVPEAVHTATFFPEPPAQAYVASALSGGARLFKAHVQVGDYDPRDPLLGPVWGLLAEAGVPVVVHAGPGPVPGRFTGAGPFGEVLARHPGLVAVLAHMGAPDYAGFLDLAARYPRVYLDTTMVFVDWGAPFPGALVPQLVGLQERVLLGSDFPNIPYPYAHQLEALARLGLGDEWLRAVCYRNGARLLGIGDHPPAAGR